MKGLEEMRHIANISFGKDSAAMGDKGFNLFDEFVFYDTGKEFQAIYNLRDKFKARCEQNGKVFTQLEPTMPFDYKMFDKPVCKRGTKEIHKHGYSWCGGTCRWGTTDKLQSLEKYCKGHYEYVGIAVDEPMRLEKERKGNKRFPLAEWDMTERDCLEYCYSQGYDWLEKTDSIYDVPEFIDLYQVLDRVSCWCCRNKNLKELKAIYYYFTNSYWQKLKDIQTLLPEPMKGVGKSVFDLEKRFEEELRQMQIRR